MPEPDVIVTGSGTIYRLSARTAAAREWIDANVEIPDYMRLGSGTSFCCEHRYVGGIVAGMQAEGLVVAVG